MPGKHSPQEPRNALFPIGCSKPLQVHTRYKCSPNGGVLARRPSFFTPFPTRACPPLPPTGGAGTGPFTPPPPPSLWEFRPRVPDHGRPKQNLIDLAEGDKMGFHPMCLYYTALPLPTVAVRRVHAKTTPNSIAFGSARRREADSQPISQFARPADSQTVSWASRQADRNTQFGFVFSGRLGSKQWGGQLLSE